MNNTEGSRKDQRIPTARTEIQNDEADADEYAERYVDDQTVGVGRNIQIARDAFLAGRKSAREVGA